MAALPPEPQKRMANLAVVGRDLKFSERAELEAQFAAEDGKRKSELDWRIALLRGLRTLGASWH